MCIKRLDILHAFLIKFRKFCRFYLPQVIFFLKMAVLEMDFLSFQTFYWMINHINLIFKECNDGVLGRNEIFLFH